MMRHASGVNQRKRAATAAVVGLILVGSLVIRAATGPTDEERMAAAVHKFTDAGNHMTPDEVRKSFGEPSEVFRNNPRALCWAYHSPYEIRMCWGPKRQAAWIGYSIPKTLRTPPG
jgi:hypothetical protein